VQHVGTSLRKDSDPQGTYPAQKNHGRQRLPVERSLDVKTSQEDHDSEKDYRWIEDGCRGGKNMPQVADIIQGHAVRRGHRFRNNQEDSELSSSYKECYTCFSRAG
jgi:hypothetical protein